MIAATSDAHLPALRGRLVELVRAADVAVIGRVIEVREVRPRQLDTTLAVERTLLGTAATASLKSQSTVTPDALVARTVDFRGQTRLLAGERYAVFLRRGANGLESVHASGTVMATPASDDSLMQSTVDGIRTALAAAPEVQAATLRRALIPALSASGRALRYYAALELGSLGQHDGAPGAGERRAIEQVLADPQLDPALRPLLETLLR